MTDLSHPFVEVVPGIYLLRKPVIEMSNVSLGWIGKTRNFEAIWLITSSLVITD